VSTIPVAVVSTISVVDATAMPAADAMATPAVGAMATWGFDKRINPGSTTADMSWNLQ
jgi:hypothetical protein